MRTPRARMLQVPLLALALVGAAAPGVAAGDASKAKAAKPADASALARGRYMVIVGGCNDCHTAGYAPSGGATPEKDWLMGDRLGFRGPWGTTYAINLRQYMQGLSEDQWVKTAKSLKTRPPMPWFGVNAMTDPDLRAIHRFVRSLGPAGPAAPAFLPPDKEPPPPFIQWPAPPK